MIALALLPGSALSQQKSLKDQLVGTWNVVSVEQTNKDGTKSQRFGANPKGVYTFDANGRFFVMFVRPDLPKIASNNPTTATPEEAKAIVAGSIAYSGTYTVDEAGKAIELWHRSHYASEPGRSSKTDYHQSHGGRIEVYQPYYGRR